MHSRFNIDQALFEDWAAFFGECFHLPPLAAKIQALLIFDFTREGVTFEELVAAFSVSKSSISTSLHILLDIGLITELSKVGRKRYFSINNEFVKLRFEELLERLTTELGLYDRLIAHREAQGEDHQEKYQIYRTLIKNSIDNIKNSLSQLYNE